MPISSSSCCKGSSNTAVHARIGMHFVTGISCGQVPSWSQWADRQVGGETLEPVRRPPALHRQPASTACVQMRLRAGGPPTTVDCKQSQQHVSALMVAALCQTTLSLQLPQHVSTNIYTQRHVCVDGAREQTTCSTEHLHDECMLGGWVQSSCRAEVQLIPL